MKIKGVLYGLMINELGYYTIQNSIQTGCSGILVLCQAKHNKS